MAKFRFQDLEIWSMSIALSERLFDIADDLERNRLYRFAEQLRGAAMSVSNNIAEGSGAHSKKEFARYLGIARKSAFENANILILLARRGWVERSELYALLDELELLCRKISSFQKALLTARKV